MDIERLKLLINNLEVVLNQLKIEIYGDDIGEEQEVKGFSSPDLDYDEIFDDEE
jgi:hypothetical protein